MKRVRAASLRIVPGQTECLPAFGRLAAILRWLAWPELSGLILAATIQLPGR